MTKRQLAEQIINTLKEHSGPGKCTWADEYPGAHASLFGFYLEDLVCDVEQVLEKHVERLKLPNEEGSML